MTRLRLPGLEPLFLLRDKELQLMEKVVGSLVVSFREPDINLVC